MALTADTFQFNKNTSAGNKGTDKESRPKALLWLNIGYPITVTAVEDGKEIQVTKFVSLPVGIPLDTSDEVPEKGSTAEFRMMQAARNELLKKLIAKGMSLQPGEEADLGGKLTIQLRRVKEDAEPIPTNQNVFIADLDL